jgi:hypothetical protein
VEEVKDSPVQAPEGMLYFMDGDQRRHSIYREELLREKQENEYMGSSTASAY